MPSITPPVLRRVINAWGTATPFGVSRSPQGVADAVASVLQRYVVVADLQAEAGRTLAHEVDELCALLGAALRRA